MQVSRLSISVIAGLLGLGTVIGGGWAAADAYGETVQFMQASTCETLRDGADGDCIRAANATVVSRSVDLIPGGSIYAPPIEKLTVTVHVEEGRGHDVLLDGLHYENAGLLYGAASPGAAARVDLWRDRVVRLAIGTEAQAFPPHGDIWLPWGVGLGGLLCLVGAALSLMYPALGFSAVWLRLAGLWIFAVFLAGLFGAWLPIWWWLPGMTAGAAVGLLRAKASSSPPVSESSSAGRSSPDYLSVPALLQREGYPLPPDRPE